MLCQVALCRDCLGDTISSFIGYNKVATETRSKFVTKTVPSCSSTQHLPSLLLKCNLNGQFDGSSASCPLAQVHVIVSKSYVFISRRFHRPTNRLWRQIRLPYWSSPTNQTAKYTDLKRGGEHRGVGHQINRFQCQIRPPQIIRTEKNVGLVRELLSPGSKAGPVKPS